MKKKIKLKNTIAAVQSYLDYINATEMSIDEDEMWSDLVKVLEEEVGEKMPTPTRFQTIKWTIEDFFQRLWWDIEDYFNPTR